MLKNSNSQSIIRKGIKAKSDKKWKGETNTWRSFGEKRLDCFRFGVEMKIKTIIESKYLGIQNQNYQIERRRRRCAH